MIKEDVILIDIIGESISRMDVPGISVYNYQPGRVIQIIKTLNDADVSITSKNTKYPLFALFLPIRERRGSSVGHYAKVRIPRLVISTITEETDDIFTRYGVSNTFKTILYPCYYEFLNQLAKSRWIIGNDPDAFEHEKMDNPGTQPVGQGSSDYVDSIELLNLELILNQIKTC